MHAHEDNDKSLSSTLVCRACTLTHRPSSSARASWADASSASATPAVAETSMGGLRSMPVEKVRPSADALLFLSFRNWAP